MSATDQADSEHTDPAYKRGVFLVCMAGVFWSTQGLAIKFMEAADAWQILFYRSISLSVFLFLVVSLRSGGKPVAAFKALGSGAILGGLCLVFAFAGGIVAVKETTVANAFFLFASAPFFGALLARLILKEKIRKATWIAIVVAMAGILVMVASQLDGGQFYGNAAAIVSALGFAVFTIILRWKRLGDTMPIVCYGGLFGTLVGGGVCYFGGGGFEISAVDLSICFAMGVGQVGLGLIVYTLGSRHVPASELALLSMAEVVLAPTWVYLFLGETMSAATAIGGVMIIGAIAGNALSGMRRRPPPPVIP